MDFKVYYSDFDREIWERELEDFVPERIFDTHCHLWNDDAAGRNTETDNILRLDADGAYMKNWSQTIFPGRKLRFYFLGTPIKDCDVALHNRFLRQEAQNHAMPTAALVTPETSAEEVAALFEAGFTGLKPYRIYAGDPATCRIADFLPEAQIEVANQYGGKITLHLSKMDGIADLDNQRDLSYFTQKYPRVQWILAHCARAFNAFMAERALDWLKAAGENVWYDMSAVCDVYAHYLLMKHLDRSRLMFGSDNVSAGSDHGNYVTWGHAWAFLPGRQCPHCNGSATLVVYEQLLAMKRAADMAGLTGDEVKNIFFNNASRLLD